MNPDRYRKIKQIVMDALEAPAAKRDALVIAACGDDDVLRRDVEALLAVDMGVSFLEHSPVEVDLGHVAPEERIGQTMGRIRIDRLIARGGMGEVYAGTDTLLKRPVAIKIMHADLRMTAVRRAAFLSEARVLSSLQHPHICAVYDFLEDQDADVLVLELLEGQTLREALDAGGPEDSLRVAEQIAAALVAAHERGIAHRDLKPENVMLTTDGSVKVLDFGIAEITRVAGGPDDAALPPGGGSHVSGTPGYMSPEQARGEPTTTATDLWSLGKLLAELLTGERPFARDASGAALIASAATGEYEIPARLPAAETRLLRQLFQVNPAQRSSARGALAAIQHIRGRSRRRVIVAVAVGIVFAAILGVAKYTTDLEREREQAERAREQAEGLVDFMIEDLHSGLQTAGRLDLFESVARKAMDYYGKVEAHRMASTRGAPASALLRIAEALTQTGDSRQGLVAAEQGATALRELHVQQADDDLVTYRLAYAEKSAGVINSMLGQYEQALAWQASGLTHARQLTVGLAPGAGPAEMPTGQSRWKLLLNSLYLYADTLVRNGEADQAAGILEEAAPLAQIAAAADPAIASDLGDIQFLRCDTYFELKRQQGLVEGCTGVLALDQQLLEANPENFQLRGNVALDHLSLARAQRLVGDLDAALTTVNAGEADLQRLVERDPDNEEWQVNRAALLNLKARIVSDLGRPQQAQAMLEQVLQITTPIANDEAAMFILNNHLSALAMTGRQTEASEVARVLHDRGFRRREFVELCRENALLEDCD